MSSSAATASPTTIWLGLDVHKESVTIAVLRGEAATSDRVDRLANDLPKLKRYLERLAGQGPLRAVYEASGAGYVLHRACTAWGVPCDVIAPSLIPTKPGVQRRGSIPPNSSSLQRTCVTNLSPPGVSNSLTGSELHALVSRCGVHVRASEGPHDLSLRQTPTPRLGERRYVR